MRYGSINVIRDGKFGLNYCGKDGALLLPACGEKVGMRGTSIRGALGDAPSPAAQVRGVLSPQAGQGEPARCGLEAGWF